MDASQEVTRDFNWLVLDTIRRMRDAKAANRIEEYISYCMDAIQLIQPYLPIDLRGQLNGDYELLNTALGEIKDKEKTDEKTKSKYALTVKLSFADAHRALIFSTLPSIGIIRISGEGDIDFGKRDADFIIAVVRNQSMGFEKAVELAKQEQEKREAKKNAGS